MPAVASPVRQRPTALLALAYRREFVALVAVGTVIRIIALALYRAPRMADSKSYLTLAHQIAAGNLSHDPGYRTPLYPAIVALCQGDASHVYLLQALMGLTISVILYLYFGLLGVGPKIALAGGLVYNLSLTSLLFEHTVLTETLSTLLVAAALFASALLLRARPPTWRHWLALGLLGGLATLTRPNFLCFALTIVIVSAIILYLRGSIRGTRLTTALAIGLLPVALLVGAWSTINYARFHWFTPSTITGYALMDEGQNLLLQPPAPPARYRLLASAYRDEAKRRPHVVVTWLAAPLAAQRTGESRVQVSRDLVGLCAWLYLHHPFEYARSVVVGVLRSWNVPELAGLRADSPGDAPQLALHLYQLVYLAGIATFFLSVALAMLTGTVRRRPWTADLLVFLLSLLVILVPTVAIDVGEVARYRAPIEAVTFGWTIVLAGTVIAAARRRWPTDTALSSDRDAVSA